MEKNYDNIHNMRAIEAMLFASAEPIHIRAIRDRIGDDADVGGLLMELQKLANQ